MSLVVLVGVIDPGGDSGRFPTVLAAFTSIEQCEEARPGILDEYHEQWPRAWMECYSAD